VTALSPNVGPVATIPAEVVQLTYETIPWELILTGALGSPPIGTPQDPIETTLTDVTRTPLVPITLTDAPVLSGTGTSSDPYLITQIVRGDELTAGHVYQLLATFAVGGVTVLAVLMLLNCPL
jgi:hypothetical protein